MRVDSDNRVSLRFFHSMHDIPMHTRSQAAFCKELICKIASLRGRGFASMTQPLYIPFHSFHPFFFFMLLNEIDQCASHDGSFSVSGYFADMFVGSKSEANC